MGGRENYQKDLAGDLERILSACFWYRVGDRLWEKSRSRLYVDEIGVFLYRLLAQQWVRTAGLAHQSMRPAHLRERTLYFKDFELDLLTGS